MFARDLQNPVLLRDGCSGSCERCLNRLWVVDQFEMHRSLGPFAPDRACVEQCAPVEHDDPVTCALDVAQYVGRHDHIDAVAAEALDEVKHLLSSGWVETRGRFVKEDELRIVHDRLGELRSLFHPCREVPEVAEPFLVQANQAEDVGCSLACRPLRKTGRSSGIDEEVCSRLVKGETRTLWHVANDATDTDRLAPGVHAERGCGACRWCEDAEQELDECRFACSIGTDESGAPSWDL